MQQKSDMLQQGRHHFETGKTRRKQRVRRRPEMWRGYGTAEQPLQFPRPRDAHHQRGRCVLFTR